MLNRWSVAMLVAGMFLGYSQAGRTLQAQQVDGGPFVIGETVSLALAADAHQSVGSSVIECPVAELRGDFVKCARANLTGNRRATDTERWVALQHVVQITRAQR
jgi:hypothetical protein